jgi:two-component sensor histidine kinase
MSCVQFDDRSLAPPPLQPLHLIDEISHRVVNEDTETICALGLAAAGAGDDRSRETLASAAGRLRAQVEAHRALQAPFAEGPIDLAGYVGRLCACLARGPLAGAGVRLCVQAEEISLGAERAWRVGLIVAELIRNAARHGLCGGGGRIWVDITEAGGRIVCEVRDDGRRAPGAVAGRGRRLVQALAADLGGAVDWVFATTGCSACLTFPSPSAHAARLPGCSQAASFDPTRF